MSLRLLAISGSTRSGSTNTAFLHALKDHLPVGIDMTIYADLHRLPVFCPDFEQDPLPAPVQKLADLIADCDGMIICSPEYIRAIPGGLKNALDWLVSREELIDKPIALAHASHRGEDMLTQLRLVLGTVSSAFSKDVFLRVPVMKLSPDEIKTELQSPKSQTDILRFFASIQENFTV